MRLILLLTLPALLLSGADANRTRPATKLPAGIPATAVAAGPGAYRDTDSSGTTWTYRQTPFGISRVEEKSAVPAAPPVGDSTRAIADGDIIRFERPGPFGVYRWQRKKTELNEFERSVWDRQRAGTASQE